MSRAPEVVALPNGVFAENCYLVADPDTREAVVIDPGEDAPGFIAQLRRRGWTPGAIWLTHAHIDHVMGVAELKRTWDVPILLHQGDRPFYDNVPRMAAMFGLTAEQPPPPDVALAEGQQVRVGAFAFDVVHTPGHSRGSVSFIGHGLAFSGDALFAGSIGRTDLMGGDMATLERSIRSKLYPLPDETRVLSGHGPETTIGVEKRTNPFVRAVAGANLCQRCGAEVQGKPWGCKNPCPNCGFVYPLGDCSD